MPRMSVATFHLLIASAFMISSADRARAANATDAEAAYTQDITKRADKIVASLGITDDTHKTRVRDLIVQQYRNLREIHAARDARINEAKQRPSDPNVAEAFVKVARDAASLKL